MLDHVYKKYDLVLVKSLKEGLFPFNELRAIVSQPPKNKNDICIWLEGYDLITYCHPEKLELIQINAVEIHRDWEKKLKNGEFITYPEWDKSLKDKEADSAPNKDTTNENAVYSEDQIKAKEIVAAMHDDFTKIAGDGYKFLT